MKDIEEKNVKKKFKITEIFTNKRYYSIANLIFYFCLILTLIILVRVTPENSKNKDKNNNDSNINVETKIDGFDYIKNKNFKFRYVFTVNGEDTIFEGKMFNDVVEFTDVINSKEYFLDGDLFLIKESDKYVLTESPLPYFNYMDVDTIEAILENATTEDDELYMTVSEFTNAIGNKSEDNDSEIYIYPSKQNNVITKIVFDIAGYVRKFDSAKSAILTLEFYDFNLVEEFSIKDKHN